MDEEVSEKTLTSSIEKNIDHLMYHSNSLNTSTKYLEQYRQWVQATRSEDERVLEKIIDHLDALREKLAQTKPELDIELTKILNWLYRKIGYKSKKENGNVGYASYEDMTLRYRDLKRELDNMRSINNQITSILPRILQEHQNMCQMNDKLDEIRYRWKLVNVAKQVEKRGATKKDSLISSMPISLSAIIFDDDTSQSYASTLLNICKRLLVVSEAIQYERDPKMEPIVTMSDILKHPPHTEVASLYVPIQTADGNGEVLAPEDKILPIAKDSAHTLIAYENGEVTATSEMNMPIAKDSATTLGSKESPKPVSEIKSASSKKSSKSAKSQKK